MKLIKNIVLNINNRCYESIVVKQRDNARYLLFKILDNTVPFNFQGKNVKLYAVKPDGKTIFNNLTVVNGECELRLTDQLLAVPGTLKCELMILEGQEKITTIPFEINVIACLNDDKAIESTNEFSALLNLMAKVEGWDSQFQNLYNQMVQWSDEKKVEFIQWLNSKKVDINTEWSNWFNTNTTKWSSDFTIWFNGIKGQLQGDIATNLQTQVNTLRDDLTTHKNTNASTTEVGHVQLSDTLEVSTNKAATSNLVYYVYNETGKLTTDTIKPTNADFSDILIIANKAHNKKVNLVINATLLNAIQGKSYVLSTLPEHLKPKHYIISDISCLDSGGNFIRVCGVTIDQNGVITIARPIEGFYSTTNKFATVIEYVAK